jgi:hypothetical protein
VVEVPVVWGLQGLQLFILARLMPSYIKDLITAFSGQQILTGQSALHPTHANQRNHGI